MAMIERLSWGRWVGAEEIAEGDRLPKGYGVAWFAAETYQAYCLPIPLNRIVGAFRAWWLDWRRPCEHDPIVRAFQRGRATGWEEGRTHGEEATHRLYKVLLTEVRGEIRQILGKEN